MNQTWLLFDNSTAYSISCTIHPRIGERRSLADAYVVPASFGDFTIAAENAAAATYDSLVAKNDAISPFVATLKLLDRTSAKTNIAGESGGLIFAIAIAKTLLKKDLPDIAATGILQPDGVVKAVGGLEKKLVAAADLVDENGYIFYPTENQLTIPQQIKDHFKSKNIHLRAVGHIEDVFNLLFDGANEISDKVIIPQDAAPVTAPKTPRVMMAAIVILILAGLLSFGIYYIKQMHPPEPVPIPQPQPSEPKPEPIAEPTVDPTLKPEPAPTLGPEPEPTLGLKPEPKPGIEPEPTLEPGPADPKPAPTPAKTDKPEIDKGFE